MHFKGGFTIDLRTHFLSLPGLLFFWSSFLGWRPFSCRRKESGEEEESKRNEKIQLSPPFPLLFSSCRPPSPLHQPPDLDFELKPPIDSSDWVAEMKCKREKMKMEMKTLQLSMTQLSAVVPFVDSKFAVSKPYKQMWAWSKSSFKHYFYNLVLVRNVNYFQILSIKIAQKSTSQICWLKNCNAICIQVRKLNSADPRLWVENTSFVQKLNRSTFSFASTTSLSGPTLSWDGDQNYDLDADSTWRIMTCDWLFSSSV